MKWVKKVSRGNWLLKEHPPDYLNEPLKWTYAMNLTHSKVIFTRGLKKGKRRNQIKFNTSLQKWVGFL